MVSGSYASRVYSLRFREPAQLGFPSMSVGHREALPCCTKCLIFQRCSTLKTCMWFLDLGKAPNLNTQLLRVELGVRF